MILLRFSQKQFISGENRAKIKIKGPFEHKRWIKRNKECPQVLSADHFCTLYHTPMLEDLRRKDIKTQRRVSLKPLLVLRTWNNFFWYILREMRDPRVCPRGNYCETSLIKMEHSPRWTKIVENPQTPCEDVLKHSWGPRAYLDTSISL